MFVKFLLVDQLLHQLFDLQLNQFYLQLNIDVPYLIQPK
jgi:hypothetical protein